MTLVKASSNPPRQVSSESKAFWCAKSLFNGPCGGTSHGRCEISSDIPCAWHKIYSRLSEQGRVADILMIRPAMEWQSQIQRTVVQDLYAERYVDNNLAN